MNETMLPMRTKSTRNHIKDTFLVMLKKKPFLKIRITALCQKAGITRATFYAHYLDIYDLVDDIMNDALIFLDSITDRTCHESFEDLWDVVRQNDLAVFKAYNDRLPPCHRLIDIPKYHPLVKDDTILPLMMKKIFAMEKGHFIAYMAEKRQFRLISQKTSFGASSMGPWPSIRRLAGARIRIGTSCSSSSCALPCMAWRGWGRLESGPAWGKPVPRNDAIFFW